MSGQLPLPQNTKARLPTSADCQELLEVSSVSLFDIAIEDILQANQNALECRINLENYQKIYGALPALRIDVRMERNDEWIEASICLKFDGSLTILTLDEEILIPKENFSASFPKTARKDRPGCIRINLHRKIDGVKKIVLDTGSLEVANKWIDALKTVVHDFGLYNWVAKNEEWSCQCQNDDDDNYLSIHYICKMEQYIAFVHIYISIIQQIEINKLILQMKQTPN